MSNNECRYREHEADLMCGGDAKYNCQFHDYRCAEHAPSDCCGKIPEPIANGYRAPEVVAELEGNDVEFVALRDERDALNKEIASLRDELASRNERILTVSAALRGAEDNNAGMKRSLKQIDSLTAISHTTLGDLVLGAKLDDTAVRDSIARGMDNDLYCQILSKISEALDIGDMIETAVGDYDFSNEIESAIEEAVDNIDFEDKLHQYLPDLRITSR